MGSEQQIPHRAVVTKGARPFTGLFLGVVFGVALAVILQQAGVWPLDRLLLFGSAGLFGLIGILVGNAGRDKVGPFASVLPLILAVSLIAFGATGLTTINETGELNGGCAVQATSSLDDTVVTDTTRSDPFSVDPEGSLSWVATSPGPITDHLWNIYVDIGGFSVPIAGNDEPEPNTDGKQENIGEVDDVSAYVREVSDLSGLELRGILEVGGDIEGEGGACDGFGFVRLESDPFATLISQIAAGVALVALLSLLMIAFNRTREAEIVIEEDPIDDVSYAGAAGAGAAGGAAAGVQSNEEAVDETPRAGSHERRDDDATPTEDVDEDEPGPDQRDDM